MFNLPRLSTRHIFCLFSCLLLALLADTQQFDSSLASVIQSAPLQITDNSNNTYFLLLGGRTGDVCNFNNVVSNVRVYNVSANEWSEGATLQDNVFGATAVQQNDHVVLIGGTTHTLANGNYFQELYTVSNVLLNTSTFGMNSFIPNLNSERVFANAFTPERNFDSFEHVLIVGGEEYQNVPSEPNNPIADIQDLYGEPFVSSTSFTQKNYTKMASAGVLVYDRFIVLAGGAPREDGLDAVTNELVVLDLDSIFNLAQGVPDVHTLTLPQAFRGACSATIDGVIYIMGGRTGTTTVLDTVIAVDTTPNVTAPSAWTISTVATMPTPRYGAACFTYNGYIVVIGGSSQYAVPRSNCAKRSITERNIVSTISLFDPQSNQWSDSYSQLITGGPIPVATTTAVPNVANTTTTSQPSTGTTTTKDDGLFNASTLPASPSYSMMLGFCFLLLELYMNI